jgi:hypothetical protein
MSNHEWHTSADWEHQWRETDDPRIIQVIERDRHFDTQVWGDVYAPAAWVEYRGAWSTNTAGEVFDDPDAWEAVELALRCFGYRSETMKRYLRIFHGIEYAELAGPSQGDTLWILDTPKWREEIGITGTSEEALAPNVETWQAYIEGDVWGIGHAVLEGRVDTETPVNLDDFDIQIEGWGYFTETWARQACDTEITAPLLHPLLDMSSIAGQKAATA